eukprot:438073_1
MFHRCKDRMVASLTVLIFLSMLPMYQSNTITSCSGGTACDCTDNEPCTVNCNGEDSCSYATINVNAASSITFICNGWEACLEATINGPTTNIPFVITCTGSSLVCQMVNINVGSASSFDLYCDGDDKDRASCQVAHINCGSGTGICKIHCTGENACNLADIDCGSASECGLLCGWNLACDNLVSLNCRNSVCWMECGTLLTSCRAGWALEGIYTTDAISFICNGIGCDQIYIDAVKTAKPTTMPTILTTEPSNNPSINPTESTAHPSVSPTYSPSKVPSNNPTTNPSIAPTEPTQLPSVSPTYSPSKGLSNNPTTEPIQTPTTCADMDPNKATNDGIDIISEIYRNFTQKNITNDYNVSYHTNHGFRSIMTCRDAAGTCHIKCWDSLSCQESIIMPKNKYVTELMIECMGQYSCYQTTINITDKAIESVSIICDTTGSCEKMKIRSNDSTMDAITIWCNEKDSCLSLDAVITTSLINVLDIYCIDEWSCHGINAQLTKTPQLNTNILCVQQHSCDLLRVQSDGDIVINLSIYQYSSNILLIHPEINNINITCGDPKNKRYFKYDTQKLMDERQIIDAARSKYDSHQMPCDDVSIQCTENPHFHQSCSMKYKLGLFNLTKLINTRQYIQCYWLEIAESLQVICDGNCGENGTYFIYNKSVPFDIYFNVNIDNESWTDKTESICHSYFRSMNETEDTLNSIDFILERILVIGSIQDSFKITDIIKSPQSILRDGLSQINCSQTFKVLLITTEIVIKSGIDDKMEFDQLFHEESPFMLEAQHLLSSFFKIPILFKQDIIEQHTEIFEGLKSEYVAAMIVLTVFMVVLIGFFIYKYYHKQKAMILQNPLIVSLAIGVYDEEPSEPEIDGYLADLNGIEVDIKNIASMFKEGLNYTLCPDYNQQKGIKQYWTKQEIIDLLKEQSLNLVNNQNVYDSLVVMMSAHGIDDCILSSDYKKIPKHDIHRLFTASNEEAVQNRNIPRIYIFDSCDGDQDRNPYSRDMVNAEKMEKGQPLNLKQENKSEEMIISPPITMQPQMSDIWSADEMNPDHKLVVINAANKNFESKMTTDLGSYFIDLFVKKIKENNSKHWFCSMGNKLYLGDIIGNIQNELEQRGKQLPTFQHFNETDKIIFVEHKNVNIMDDVEEKLLDQIDDFKEDENDEKVQDEVEMVDIPIKDIKANKSGIENDSDDESLSVC